MSASANLRLIRGSAHASRHGCSTPPVKIASAPHPRCAAAVTLTGTIDPRAAKTPLTVTASAPWQHPVTARIVLAGASWTVHLKLPLSAHGKLAPWKLAIAFRGNAALAPVTLAHTLSPRARTHH